VKVFQVLFDVLSVVPHSDSPGSLKLPLLMRSKSPLPEVSEEVTAKGSKLSVLLPIAFLGLLSSGCGATSRQVGVDIGACALGQVPAAVSSVIPEVTTAIQGSATDWSSELVKLEGQGIDFAICAVEKVIADLSKGHAMLSASAERSVDRAQVALEMLKAKAK
jgi:hypothetical protein